jgi:hypothetical protein
MAERIDVIQSEANNLGLYNKTGCKLAIQIQNYGGPAAQFRVKGQRKHPVDGKALTAFSWRDDTTVISVMDCFYDVTWKRTAKETALGWQVVMFRNQTGIESNRNRNRIEISFQNRNGFAKNVLATGTGMDSQTMAGITANWNRNRNSNTTKIKILTGTERNRNFIPETETGTESPKMAGIPANRNPEHHYTGRLRTSDRGSAPAGCSATRRSATRASCSGRPVETETWATCTTSTTRRSVDFDFSDILLSFTKYGSLTLKILRFFL